MLISLRPNANLIKYYIIFVKISSTRGNESNQEQLGFSQSPVSVRKIQPAQKLATTSSSESVAHISRMYSQPPAVVSLHPVGSLAQISCAYKSPRETLDGKNTMIDETLPKKNILECLYHDSNQGKMVKIGFYFILANFFSRFVRIF